MDAFSAAVRYVVRYRVIVYETSATWFIDHKNLKDLNHAITAILSSKLPTKLEILPLDF